MHKTSRLVAGLCLLGACAYAGATPPLAEPRKEAPREEPSSVPDLAWPDEPRAQTDPVFMLRVADFDSASAAQPLYLMDGNPLVGEPYLRPVDIVSVEVVTGQAAAMRYGVHPSRTVVLVTTTWGQARGQS